MRHAHKICDTLVNLYIKTDFLVLRGTVERQFTSLLAREKVKSILSLFNHLLFVDYRQEVSCDLAFIH